MASFGVGGGGPGEEPVSYTCLTAPGVVFPDKAAFHAHYKSDWHRYNLKRKTATLPMLGFDEFEARRLAALGAGPKKKELDHVKPSKRERSRANRDRKAGFQDKSGSKVAASQLSGYRKSEDPGAVDAADVEEEEEPAPEEITSEARPTDSFFDGARLESTAAALEYMRARFGFVVPEAAFLADAVGLAGYLCAKVKIGRTCLCCEQQFRSYRAAQQHMIDMCHCRVPYVTDEEVEALADFYDFSATYAGLDEEDQRALAPDDDAFAAADAADGWETASDGGDSSDGERAIASPTAKRAARVKVTAAGELQLKRGGKSKVVGARWLRRYYKQNHRIEDDRDAVVAVAREESARLLAAYAKAGVPTTSEGFFAKGMVAQFNRRTLNKQIHRDQRAEQRQRMLTEGFRSGGKAKDFKQNKLIKHAVAGKNRGEGLGVHG